MYIKIEVMNKTDKKKKVAILATNGFEESELLSPKEALENAGVEVEIVSENNGAIRGWKDENWSINVNVDKTLDNVSATDYCALHLPGGVANPDKLRRNEKAISFIRDFFAQQKPVSAICHAPWLLAEADVLKGRKITSFESIKTDMLNAGANWVDEEVVVDNGLTTSRTPKDLPAFNRKIAEEVMEGKHDEQTV